MGKSRVAPTRLILHGVAGGHFYAETARFHMETTSSRLGNDSIPHRNEPKPTVGGWKPMRSRSNRHGNDRKPHGGAAKPIRFVAKLIGFAPTPHRFASK